MKNKIFLITVMALTPLLWSGSAEAAYSCKNYSKTVRSGHDIHIGYGTVCKVRRGLWEIVSLSGDIDIRDMIVHKVRKKDRKARVIVKSHYKSAKHSRRHKHCADDYGRYGYYKNHNHYKTGHRYGHDYYDKSRYKKPIRRYYPGYFYSYYR